MRFLFLGNKAIQYYTIQATRIKLKATFDSCALSPSLSPSRFPFCRRSERPEQDELKTFITAAYLLVNFGVYPLVLIVEHLSVLDVNNFDCYNCKSNYLERLLSTLTLPLCFRACKPNSDRIQDGRGTETGKI